MLFWKASLSYTKQHLRKSKRFIFNRFLKGSKSPKVASRARCKTWPSLSIKVPGLQWAGLWTKLEAQIKDVFWAKPLVGRGPVWLNCFVPHRREETSVFFILVMVMCLLWAYKSKQRPELSRVFDRRFSWRGTQDLNPQTGWNLLAKESWKKD